MKNISTEYEVMITDNKNKAFLELILLLDADLNSRNDVLQEQYNKHNKIDNIRDVVLIYWGDLAVACGAFKEYDASTVELKRIFVRKEHRGKGLAKSVVKELESLALSKDYKTCILETGHKHVEALNLYKKCGYEVINNFGPYEGMEDSICLKKDIKEDFKKI